MNRGSRVERGSIIPEFVLVLILMLPLVWGILHVAFVLHVRNTVVAAASDGARAAAAYRATDDDGKVRARSAVTAALADHHAANIRITRTPQSGGTVVQVRIDTHVSWWGGGSTGTRVVGEGHAVVQEVP